VLDDWNAEAAASIVSASSNYDRNEAEAIAATREKPLYRALALVWYRRKPRKKGQPELRRT
jgi:hypothetical protein